LVFYIYLQGYCKKRSKHFDLREKKKKEFT